MNGLKATKILRKISPRWIAKIYKYVCFLKNVFVKYMKLVVMNSSENLLKKCVFFKFL